METVSGKDIWHDDRVKPCKIASILNKTNILYFKYNFIPTLIFWWHTSFKVVIQKRVNTSKWSLEEKEKSHVRCKFDLFANLLVKHLCDHGINVVPKSGSQVFVVGLTYREGDWVYILAILELAEGRLTIVHAVVSLVHPECSLLGDCSNEVKSMIWRMSMGLKYAIMLIVTKFYFSFFKW